MKLSCLGLTLAWLIGLRLIPPVVRAGQPGAPDQPRFPAWCYGMAYPVSALTYSGNIHSVSGHAVLAVAVDNARFVGNALGGYDKTRACE